MLPLRRLACLTALLVVPALAHAGPYGDDLTKCLVSSTTADDKAALVRWIFVNAALHPQISALASVSQAQREEVNAGAGRLMERLLTDVCRDKLQLAMRYEGSRTIEAGFGVLGQVAMRELMTDQNVARGFSAVDRYVDREKMKKALEGTN